MHIYQRFLREFVELPTDGHRAHQLARETRKVSRGRSHGLRLPRSLSWYRATFPVRQLAPTWRKTGGETRSPVAGFSAMTTAFFLGLQMGLEVLVRMMDLGLWNCPVSRQKLVRTERGSNSEGLLGTRIGSNV